MKLFTPGPVEMDEQTMAIGGTQTQYFRTPQFSKLMLENVAMLKTVLDAPEDARMIFLTASGTGAMEATVMNLFTSQDKVLIIAGGNFGRRFKEICMIHKIPVEVIEFNWNEAFKPEMLEPYENAGITGMLVNMCETSTGQLYPMDIISSFCKRNHICLVVDAISAFLCDDISMKETGADAVFVSSQKGLALNPGMSFIAVTKEAFDERCVKHPADSLYFRFTGYYPEILRGQTEFTPAISIINQLNDKLHRIIDVGVESYVSHCASLARYFRAELIQKTQLSYTDYPLSNCVTPVICPGNNARRIVDILRDVYNVFVVPAAGDLEKSMFRVGHMSYALNIADIDSLINLLKIIEKC